MLVDSSYWYISVSNGENVSLEFREPGKCCDVCWFHFDFTENPQYLEINWNNVMANSTMIQLRHPYNVQLHFTKTFYDIHSGDYSQYASVDACVFLRNVYVDETTTSKTPNCLVYLLSHNPIFVTSGFQWKQIKLNKAPNLLSWCFNIKTCHDIYKRSYVSNQHCLSHAACI